MELVVKSHFLSNIFGVLFICKKVNRNKNYGKNPAEALEVVGKMYICM